MKLLAVAIAGVLLTGCIGGDKSEAICEEFARSVATDPGGLKVNSIKKTAGSLREDVLGRHYAGLYPQGLSESAAKLLALQKAELAEARDIFIQVDYTANERGGPVRDVALCRFFEWPHSSELVSLTIRSRDYLQHEFAEIFARYGKPKGLSSTYRIE